MSGKAVFPKGEAAFKFAVNTLTYRKFLYYNSEVLSSYLDGSG